MVAERWAGRACFAEVKEESDSPLAACRTGDMEQSRPSRTGAIAQNQATAPSPKQPIQPPAATRLATARSINA